MPPLLALLLAASPAAPVLAEGPLPRFTATPLTEAPILDGKLDDPAWVGVPIEGGFVQRTPAPGLPPSMRTGVQFAYDRTHLYVAIRCQDVEPTQVSQRLTRRDRVIESDSVTVELDSRGDHRSAYGFGVYPSGVQLDYLRTGDSAQDYDWDAVWTSAVARDAQGYTVELAIPFSALRFTAGPEVSFRVEVTRYVSRLGETDQLVFQPPSEQGALLRMATLGGLRGLPSGHGLELRPFAVLQLDHRSSPGPAFDPPSGNALHLGVGGDLTFHPGNDLVLDATVLPDFGQVEADQVVLNLTTFETFFPEKRAFFVSGADLFALHDDLGNVTETQIFYSRRVGRAPGAPALNAGERLLSQPTQDDIWGAVKLTGRASEHLSLALLDAVSSRSFATLQGPGGGASQVAVSPLTNFGVARLRGELPGGFTLGGTATGVTRRDRGLGQARGLSQATDESGAPTSDGRCTHDAYTGALDSSWSSPRGTYVASAALLASKRVGGPARTFADGTVLRAGDTGLGGVLGLSKAGGAHWIGDLRYEGYSPKLDLNDVGYLRQQNLHKLTADLGYRTTEPWGPTRRTDTQLQLFESESTEGVNLTRQVWLDTSFQWANLWASYLELDYGRNVFDDRETRDGSPYQRSGYLGFFASTHSDARKILSFDGYLYAGRNTGTSVKAFQLSSAVELTLRASERLELTLTPGVDWSAGEPRWVRTDGDLDAPHRYLFGDLDARDASLTLRGIFTFTPTLSLQAYAQLFLATGHYGPFFAFDAGPGRARILVAELKPTEAPAETPDFKDGAVNVNVVLRWAYRPGSAVYLVYARTQTPGDATLGLSPQRPDLNALRRGPSDDLLLLKASLDFDT